MFTRLLGEWVGWVTRRAVRVMLVLLAVTCVLGWVAYDRFRLNSNLNALINQQTQWRADFDAFERQFPDLVHTSVLVLSAPSVADLEVATRDIMDYLEARPESFSAVAAPGSEAFFRDHALLFMDLDALDDVTDRLARAQPWLTAVARDRSLAGILELLSEGVLSEPTEGFDVVLEHVADAAGKARAGEDPQVSWSDELLPVEGLRFQLIFLKAPPAFDAALPDAPVMAELRRMRDRVPLPAGVDLALTGEIALQHEEIEAAITGVALAGWLAVALLFLVLVLGVRSIKIVVATFAMLAIGVVWTSAYAMLSVGQYNTLSIVFLVMFFGLGVDFALHYSLRFQEAINRGQRGVAEALLASTRSVGRAISLCTVTTALGFLGFWPTDYQGLADLGVISAGGMAIAWFLTFTFLPAFYALTGAPRAHEMDLPSSDRVIRWLLARRTRVIGVVTLVSLVAVYFAAQARFDYSVLALKDPDSESMRTLRRLQAEGLATDYRLVVVDDGPVDKQPLLTLSVVDDVVVPLDHVPDDQEQKLLAIEDLQAMLWSALTPATGPPTDLAGVKARAAQLLDTIEASLQAQDAGTMQRLAAQLRALEDAPDDVWLAWQNGVVGDLKQQLAWLQRALAVEAVTFDDLPASLRDRLVSANAQQLSVISPAEDIAPVQALSRFIDGVRAIYPNATGRPVIEWGVGAIVVEAFQQALLFALVSIALVLLCAVRSVWTTLLILIPLFLAGVYSLALGVLFDQPINMANILVVPLIFGLGVDNGIHVVDRYLGEGDVDHLIHSSTPRAVLLSTLTTLGAFAALSLSPHQGTASIGLLLTISIGCLLILTLFLLPVLLSRRYGASRAAEPDYAE